MCQAGRITTLPAPGGVLMQVRDVSDDGGSDASLPRLPRLMEQPMNEEALNLSIRKFLKMVGVSSQREIEHAVSAALAAGRSPGTETLPATMTLEVAGLRLRVAFDGEIRLQ